MLPRLSSLQPSNLRPFIAGVSPFLSNAMARVVARALPLAFKSPPINIYAFRSFSRSHLFPSSTQFASSYSNSSIFGRRFHVLYREDRSSPRAIGGVFATQRGYRKVRRRPVKKKEKELELDVRICIEEELPDDSELLSIAEMLRLNVPMAMKLAFDGLKDSEYKTRDIAIDDVGGFESVELSVLLCNDEFIRKLNKDWRDEDHATDVLSMSQHIPELKLPILMLGDIVISVETAARQAEERGHTLLDEIRILMFTSPFR